MDSEKRIKITDDVPKYIVFLVTTLLLYNIFTFGLTKVFILKPNILKFRIVCTCSQIITFCILFFAYKPSISELGFNWENIKISVKIFSIIGYCILILLVVSSYFIMRGRAMFAFITNMHFGLSTPIFEEIIFRGYWWDKLRKKYKTIIVLIISSISFSLFHLGYYFIIEYAALSHSNAPEMVNIILTKVGLALLLGLVLSVLRIITKTVNIPIIIHGILNIIGD